ncbi:MAG: tRNA (guanosine(46)-N7)-methyltransferase TrmB [Candidatus Acetothermia bacterium]|jgi:tRNA (guanine-N7-)-methyltransferase|nr:tRNA (guanosine(46)-N7)-methyltransferase TrmB [Candidatus Acetothermia bacterium]
MGSELKRYLVRPERWEALPADWDAVFGRSAPLAVEIGFGSGEFLSWAAREHPGWNWVGFETSLTCITKAGRKLAQWGARNVRLALVDGQFALRELFPDESVARVYVHFPCPWPKARHAERRLVGPGFGQTLAAVLAPDGLFILTTDVLWYAEDAAACLAEANPFRVTGPQPLVEEGPGTRYERKWRGQGRAIWQVVAERRVKGAIQRIAEGTMPHVRIAVPVTPETVARAVGLREAWPGGAFAVKEAFFAPDGKTALLRAFATDDDFQQHYFLAVVNEREGAMVKLDGATVPFRTPAVKRSVAAVAAALEGR